MSRDVIRAPAASSGLLEVSSLLGVLCSRCLLAYPKVMVPRMTLGLPVPALMSGILAVVVVVNLMKLDVAAFTAAFLNMQLSSTWRATSAFEAETALEAPELTVNA